MTRQRPLARFLFPLAVLVIAGMACAPTGAKDMFAPAASSAPAQSDAALKLAAGGAPAAAQPAPAARPAAAPAASGAGSAVSQNASAALEVQAQASQPLDRMIIRNAQLSIEVADIEATLAQVRNIAQLGGGFVSNSNTHVEKVNDVDRTVADLTIQVRSDTADSSLSSLRALGKVTSETSGSQDVTEEYVDLDSNLRNLQASEAALLKLLDKATRIEDILPVQRELSNIRGQIERLQGRKRFLERRADMATIALSLRLPAPESTRPVIGGAWDPASVAARGWQASLTVLRTIAEVVIVVLAFSWWLVPLAAFAAYVVLQRRRPRPTEA